MSTGASSCGVGFPSALRSPPLSSGRAGVFVVRSKSDWWSQFGDECPELQKFAIRVLSLTSSASGCERNWSSFNQVHTKRRNRLTQVKLNDLVYVMFNLKLKHREIRRKTMEDPLCLDDVDSGDEWVSELQSCDFEAFQELDANTPIEDDVVEVEDEADGQGNSRQKRRKDKGKAVVDVDEEEFQDDEVSDEGEDEARLKYMDDSFDDPISSSSSDDDLFAEVVVGANVNEQENPERPEP